MIKEAFNISKRPLLLYENNMYLIDSTNVHLHRQYVKKYYDRDELKWFDINILRLIRRNKNNTFMLRYADETNRNIIIKLISDYRKDILGEVHISCKDEIARFMGRLEHGPVCVYFESFRVAYDNLYEYRDTDDTYAARHDYKVIKLEHKHLMTIE